jgi:hypothetical protein
MIASRLNEASYGARTSEISEDANLPFEVSFALHRRWSRRALLDFRAGGGGDRSGLREESKVSLPSNAQSHANAPLRALQAKCKRGAKPTERTKNEQAIELHLSADHFAQNHAVVVLDRLQRREHP